MTASGVDTLSIAYRILERPGPNDWFALLAAPAEAERAARAVEHEIRELDAATASSAYCKTASEFWRTVTTSTDDVLLIWGLHNLSAQGWARVDGQRSQLRR